MYNENGGFNWQGKDPDFLPQFATIWVTHDFGNTISWEVIDGRDFSIDFATDSVGLIVTFSDGVTIVEVSSGKDSGLDADVGATVEPEAAAQRIEGDKNTDVGECSGSVSEVNSRTVEVSKSSSFTGNGSLE